MSNIKILINWIISSFVATINLNSLTWDSVMKKIISSKFFLSFSFHFYSLFINVSFLPFTPSLSHTVFPQIFYAINKTFFKIIIFGLFFSVLMDILFLIVIKFYQSWTFSGFWSAFKNIQYKKPWKALY